MICQTFGKRDSIEHLISCVDMGQTPPDEALVLEYLADPFPFGWANLLLLLLEDDCDVEFDESMLLLDSSIVLSSPDGRAERGR